MHITLNIFKANDIGTHRVFDSMIHQSGPLAIGRVFVKERQA